MGAGAGSGRNDEPERKRRRVVSVKREVKVKREGKQEVKQERGLGQGDAKEEEEEEEEEEMMFDSGRERRGERRKGGAGRKKKVGPARRHRYPPHQVLGHYAHIDEAKAFMRGVGLKSMKAFQKWRKTAARPVEMIPSHPDRAYKDCGWNGWPDFLGNANTDKRNQNRNWRSLEAATTYVQALGLKSKEAWEEWSKSGDRPEDIPATPHQVYKKQGWVGYPEFLGFERDAHHPVGQRKKGKGK